MRASVVVNLDNGIIGTFDKMVKHNSEEGYGFLHYFLPNRVLFKKRIKHHKPIPISAVKTVETSDNYPGVIPRITFIYEGGEGSLLNQIFESEFKKDLDKYKDENRSLRQQIAALKQDLEDARGSAKKTIASAKSLSRSQERQNDPFNTFGTPGGYRNDAYGDDDYSDFPD